MFQFQSSIVEAEQDLVTLESLVLALSMNKSAAASIKSSPCRFNLNFFYFFIFLCFSFLGRNFTDLVIYIFIYF